MATQKQATDKQIAAGKRFGLNLESCTMMEAMRILESKFAALRQQEWSKLISRLESDGIVEGARVKYFGRTGTIRYFDHKRMQAMVEWEGERTANGKKLVSDAHPRHFTLA